MNRLVTALFRTTALMAATAQAAPSEGVTHEEYPADVAIVQPAPARTADLPSGAGPRLLVVASDIEDGEILAAAAKEGVHVIRYDSARSSLADLARLIHDGLGGRKAESIAIATHGAADGPRLHLTAADAASPGIFDDSTQQAFWTFLGGDLVADGRIDLLACDVTADPAGEQFVASIERISGRAVAASSDPTGSAARGGNWVLERGQVDLRGVYFETDKVERWGGILAVNHYHNDVNASGGYNILDNQSAEKGVWTTFSFSDSTFHSTTLAAGTPPTYTVTGKPAWLSWYATDRAFYGTPKSVTGNPLQASYTITVTASDGSGTDDSLSFILKIANVTDSGQHVPVYADGDPASEFSIIADDPVGTVLTPNTPIAATDADTASPGALAGYRFIAPTSATIPFAIDATGRIRSTVSPLTPGTVNYTVEAYDGTGYQDTAHVTINIATRYSITTAASPVAGGSVTCSPNPVIQGSDTTCTASANAGYTFDRFSGDCSGATCNLTNVTQDMSVVANFLINQSLTFNAAPTVVVGGTGTVSATGGASGNPVTFTSQTPAVCTTSGTNGTTVFGVVAGTCTIAANQAGNDNYAAAAQATQGITITGGAAKRIHVKADAAGVNDGTTWANAFTKLADALAAANRGDDLWVAKGVYYPDQGAGRTNDDAFASFAIPDGVQLYGGFAGTETAVGQRDWTVSKTILSGDIGQDDTDTDGNRVTESWGQIQGSNSRHVVATGAVDSSTALDGFIITGGDGGASNTGGGWYNDGGSPTLTNVQFLGNRGSYGGGMESSGSPDLANVLFWGNRAEQKGGGLYLSGGNAVATNASFNGNSAGSGAGSGGGIAMQAGSPSLANVILWGDVNGELAIGGASPTFTGSLIQGCGGSAAWKSTCGGDGGGNKDAVPLFVNATKGDLHLSSALSPAYKSGGVALAQAANLTTDLQGGDRFQTVGKVDMGAYEQLLSTTTTATGTAGSDVVIVQRTTLTVSAGDGDDVIYNAIGKQTMKGGAGTDRFFYTSITERTDIIEDFSGNFGTAEGDRLDLSQLMLALGCKVSAGCSPLAAGSYVSFQDATGGVYVMIDIDGPGPLTSKTQLAFLRNVTGAQINSTGNFVF